MDLGVKGRVALVTGASKGLGHGIAAALAGEGVRVAISSRSRARIDPAAEQIGATGFVLDSADLDSVPAVVDEVERALGPVDILVANTGGPAPNPDALGHSRAEWEDAYRNLSLFPLTLIERVLPGMRERGWGRIVSVSSIAVREPIGPLVLSNSHRSATLAALKTIAGQVAGDGVTINSILPGRIATDRLLDLGGSREQVEAAAREQVPAGRLGTVEEFAAVAAFLCSTHAAYVTGEALRVDGGLTHSV